MKTCLHCLVSGRVQGVYFRHYTRQQAQRLGVSGWVRNLTDGRVEVLACGKSQSVEALKTWLNQGPPLAQVTELICKKKDNEMCTEGFEIR